jgi:hypothetical protein
MASSEEKRGALLDTWLYILLLANIGGLLWYSLSYLLSAQRYSISSIQATWILAWCLLLSLNVISLSFVFRLKKWGFFGVCVITAIGLGWDLLAGTGAIALLRIVGVSILFILVRPKWKLFS